jgi:hypothetical protein
MTRLSAYKLAGLQADKLASISLSTPIFMIIEP